MFPRALIKNVIVVLAVAVAVAASRPVVTANGIFASVQLSKARDQAKIVQ